MFSASFYYGVLDFRALILFRLVFYFRTAGIGASPERQYCHVKW
jgi:hypothetical protein